MGSIFIEHPISEKCRLLRERLNLTQQEMADEFGVRLQTWQNWEAGIHSPRGPALKLLAQMEQWPPVDYAARCRQLRTKLGLNKAEMAARLGVTAYTYGQWEAAAVRPQPSARRKIDQLLVGEL